MSMQYTKKQLERYMEFCSEVNSGHTTMNQAYRNATGEGYQGSFADWVQTAKSAGWIDKGLDVLNTMLSKNKPNWDQQQPQPQPKKGISTKHIIGYGALATGFVVAMVLITKYAKS